MANELPDNYRIPNHTTSIVHFRVINCALAAIVSDTCRSHDLGRRHTLSEVQKTAVAVVMKKKRTAWRNLPRIRRSAARRDDAKSATPIPKNRLRPVPDPWPLPHRRHITIKRKHRKRGKIWKVTT